MPEDLKKIREALEECAIIHTLQCANQMDDSPECFCGARKNHTEALKLLDSLPTFEEELSKRWPSEEEVEGMTGKIADDIYYEDKGDLACLSLDIAGHKSIDALRERLIGKGKG